MKQAIAFSAAIVIGSIAACGTSSRSTGGNTPASISFAISGGDFSGNSVRICGSRTPPADSKYLCNNSLSSPDATASACPCFNFAPDGTLIDPMTGGPALVQDLCASEDVSADASVGAPAGEWTFTYSVFDSPGCTGLQLNDGTHDFACYDVSDLATLAHPNESVELLHPLLNQNQVGCWTFNAFKSFNFESCTETCNAPAGATLGPSCTQTRFACGCTLTGPGVCSCGPDGGLTLADLPPGCFFDLTTCDILCPTSPPDAGVPDAAADAAPDAAADAAPDAACDTAPTVTPPSITDVATCGLSVAYPANLGIATFTSCNPSNTTLSGTVLSRGTGFAPVPIFPTSAGLSPGQFAISQVQNNSSMSNTVLPGQGYGTYTVAWTARDNTLGLTSPTVNQTVTVRPMIQSVTNFTINGGGHIEDEFQITSTENSLITAAQCFTTLPVPGAFCCRGVIYNSGTGGSVSLASGTCSGAITSATTVSLNGTGTPGFPPITLLVNNAFTGDTVVVPSGFNVLTSGSITAQNISRRMPVILPSLPTPVAPTGPANGSTIISTTSPSTPLTPGVWTSVTVNGGTGGARATLNLDGSYSIGTLTINTPTGVTINATPTTRLYVGTFSPTTLTVPFTSSTGGTASIFLAYSGTAALALQAAFNGTLVAPSATVTFGTTSSELNFLGSFYASSITVAGGAGGTNSLECAINPPALDQ